MTAGGGAGGEVRTRIAPSPTGAPHIGTAYIALHNLAFARSRGGKFLLRIEDTDQARSAPEHEVAILEALRWLGIGWDEGPDIGGPHGPYRQSERLPLYRRHADVLLAGGRAYRCFCTKERLDALRAEQVAKKQDPGYDGLCRQLSAADAARRAAAGEPHVVRLRVEREGSTAFFDDLRGQEIAFENAGIDDQVLLKADGFPTYHLANVVDDHEMRITHVMRGEEWISSTPKHVLLYRAFGWEATMPRFMHLPLLRNADKSKISKRKNPTSLRWFRARGYCRPAMVNFLGLMGYSMKDGREHFGMEELFADYDPARLSTTAPVFDFVKLEDFNLHWLMQADDAAFIEWQVDAARAAAEFVRPLLPELKKRCRRRADLARWTEFLFERDLPLVVADFQLPGLEKDAALAFLKELAKRMEEGAPRTADACRAAVEGTAEKKGLAQQAACMLARLAVMGAKASLPLFEAMEFCGADLCQRRFKEAHDLLKARWAPPKKG